MKTIIKKDQVNRVIKMIHDIKKGDYSAKIPVKLDGDMLYLGKAVLDLGQLLKQQDLESKRLLEVTQQMNKSMVFEDVLNFLYDNFRDLIPYNRIGVSFLSDNGKNLIAHWARSDADAIFLDKGYSSKIEGSSLNNILISRQPRIINDLEQYLKEHPKSDSTSKIVKEGIKSSLTCPLFKGEKPIGFIFFSSFKKLTYKKNHISIYLQLAGEIALILEKSKLYSEIVEQKKNLEELNSVKNKFIGIIAHDLRNPLSAIKLFSNYLNQNLEFSTSNKIKDGLVEISSTAEHMLNLVNDLLDISIIESGTLKIKKELIEVIPFVSKIIERNSLLFRDKKINIHMKTPVEPIFASFDPDKISQVLNNLISNAAKFSLPETNIDIVISSEPDQVVFEVIDEGPGINEEEISNLFVGFYRGKAKPTGGEKSTGLGLAICKKMVDAHDGSIEVRNRIDKGSSFIVKIPKK